jgi:hypothetical protein
MIRIASHGRTPVIAVLMTTGEALATGAPGIFPDIGANIWERVTAMA